MKKISLIILAFALTFSACKNYDDEFAAASASIAELQTQVAGFSTLQAKSFPPKCQFLLCRRHRGWLHTKLPAAKA